MEIIRLARTVRAVTVCLSIGFTACAGGGGSGGGGGGHGMGMGMPGATLTSLSPSSIAAGSPAFSLTVNGSGFVAGGTLSWNGTGLGPYTFVSSSQVTVLINASLVVSAGSASIVATIPTPGTNPSNAMTFTTDAFTTSACVLFGPYDFFLTGFDSNGPVTIAGNFGVDAAGNVTGEQDFKNVIEVRAAEPITGGSCKNSATANEGTLALTTAAGTSTYAFATQAFPAANKTGGLTESGGATGISGSGRFFLAPPAGFFSGDYVLGLVGVDSHQGRMTVIGRLTDSNGNMFSNPGTIAAGMADINDAGATTASAPITGTVAVPDAYSRSAVTVTIGAQAFHFALYVKSSQLGVAVDVDSGASSPLLAGFVNTQNNPGTYGNGHLNAPLLLNAWGSSAGPPATSSTTLARASNFNSAAGTFDLNLDSVAGSVASLNQTVTGATYSVASNGRATASFSVGGKTYNYVFYLDADNDGYIADNSGNVAYGFFEAQANGPFANSSINGTFMGATWFPAVPASPNNIAMITLNNGSISGSLSGTYVVDSTGRGTATVNLPAFGSNDLVFYVIGPGAINVMGSDGVAADAVAFLHQ
jgi:hypothetical protein